MSSLDLERLQEQFTSAFAVELAASARKARCKRARLAPEASGKRAKEMSAALSAANEIFAQQGSSACSALLQWTVDIFDTILSLPLREMRSNIDVVDDVHVGSFDVRGASQVLTSKLAQMRRVAPVDGLLKLAQKCLFASFRKDEENDMWSRLLLDPKTAHPVSSFGSGRDIVTYAIALVSPQFIVIPLLRRVRLRMSETGDGPCGATISDTSGDVQRAVQVLELAALASPAGIGAALAQALLDSLTPVSDNRPEAESIIVPPTPLVPLLELLALCPCTLHMCASAVVPMLQPSLVRAATVATAKSQARATVALQAIWAHAYQRGQKGTQSQCTSKVGWLVANVFDLYALLAAMADLTPVATALNELLKDVEAAISAGPEVSGSSDASKMSSILATRLQDVCAAALREHQQLKSAKRSCGTPWQRLFILLGMQQPASAQLAVVMNSPALCGGTEFYAIASNSDRSESDDSHFALDMSIFWLWYARIVTPHIQSTLTERNSNTHDAERERDEIEDSIIAHVVQHLSTQLESLPQPRVKRILQLFEQCCSVKEYPQGARFRKHVARFRRHLLDVAAGEVRSASNCTTHFCVATCTVILRLLLILPASRARALTQQYKYLRAIFKIFVQLCSLPSKCTCVCIELCKELLVMAGQEGGLSTCAVLFEFCVIELTALRPPLVLQPENAATPVLCQLRGYGTHNVLQERNAIPSTSTNKALHVLDIIKRAIFLSTQPVTQQQETELHADPARVTILASVLLQCDQNSFIGPTDTMPDKEEEALSTRLATRMPPGELLCVLDLVATVPAQLVRCLHSVQDTLRSLATQWQIKQQCHVARTSGVTRLALAGVTTSALLETTVQSLRLVRRVNWLPAWHDVLADAVPILPPAAISKLLEITANFLDSNPPDASMDAGMESSSDDRQMCGSQTHVPDVQSVLLANVDVVAPLFARFLELTHREAN